MLKNHNPLVSKVRRVLSQLLPPATKTKLTPEARYYASVEQAFQQAPFYRARATTLAELLQPRTWLTPEIWAAEFERLFPFSAPPQNSSERYFPVARFAELHEALVLTGSYRPNLPLFEIAEQWEQPVQLEKNQGWHYLLPAPQVASKFRPNQYQPDNFARHWQQPDQQVHFALLGDFEQLEWALSAGLTTKACQKLQQIFVRLQPATSLADLAHLRQLAQAKSQLENLDYVLYEPVLGYWGAFARQCNSFHLNTQRVWAVADPTAQLLFSKLGQTRPFVLHYCPTTSNFSGLNACAVHGGVVLQPQLTANTLEETQPKLDNAKLYTQPSASF